MISYIFKGNCTLGMSKIVSSFVTRFTNPQALSSAWHVNMFPTRHPAHGANAHRETIMKLHLISGAVVAYTLLTLLAICLAELNPAPQNVPF